MNTKKYTTAQLQTIKQTLQALKPKQAQTQTKQYTKEQLEAMTVEQLIDIYVALGLRSTRMNFHFIVQPWLIEDILAGQGK